MLMKEQKEENPLRAKEQHDKAESKKLNHKNDARTKNESLEVSVENQAYEQESYNIAHTNILSSSTPLSFPTFFPVAAAVTSPPPRHSSVSVRCVPQLRSVTLSLLLRAGIEPNPGPPEDERRWRVKFCAHNPLGLQCSPAAQDRLHVETRYARFRQMQIARYALFCNTVEYVGSSLRRLARIERLAAAHADEVLRLSAHLGVPSELMLCPGFVRSAYNHGCVPQFAIDFAAARAQAPRRAPAVRHLRSTVFLNRRVHQQLQRESSMSYRAIRTEMRASLQHCRHESIAFDLAHRRLVDGEQSLKTYLRAATQMAEAQFRRLLSPGPEPTYMPGPTFSMASFNCRTLKVESSAAQCTAGGDANILALILFAKRHLLEVVCIQEHRRSSDDGLTITREVNGEQWTLYLTRATNGVGGVGMLLAPHIAKGATIDVLNERTMSLGFSTARTKNCPGLPVTVVCTYAPHAMNADAQETHLTELGAYVKRFGSRGPIFVAGDFNAALAPGDSGPFGISDRYLGDMRTAARLRLAAFLCEHRLGSAATYFDSTHWTFFPDSGSRVTKCMLDHVLVPDSWTVGITCARTLAAPFSSDHVPVLATIRLDKRTVPKKAPSRPDWTYLRALTPAETQAGLPDYLSRVKDAVGALTNAAPPTIDTWSDWAAAVCGVATKILPPKMRTSANLEIDVNDPALNVEHAMRDQLAAAKRCVESARNGAVNRLCDVIDKMLVTSQSKAAYQAVRALSKPKRHALLVEGNTKAERTATIAATCGSQLQAVVAPEAVHFPKVDAPLEFDSKPFTKQEVAEAVSRLKRDKAPGSDAIPSELLRLDCLADAMTTLLNEVFSKNEMPTAWKKITFAMIPKAKGSLKQAANWRYIALMCVAAKLYHRLLLARLEAVIDPHLRWNQNGFRRNRSTLHHALALQHILDAAKHQGMPLAMCFVDSRSAFPSVTWPAIRAALEAYHVPPKLIGAVMLIYSDVQGSVRTPEGETLPFDITQGVMQGDTLAPFLFILVLDCVMRNSVDRLVHKGIEIRPQRIARCERLSLAAEHLTDLDFADDIVLMSQNVSDLSELLLALGEEAAKANLLFNFGKGKTEFMTFNAPGELSYKGKPVLKTDDYRYLGCWTNIKSTITTRTALAHLAFASLNPIWRSPSVHYDNKARLFRSIVEPALLYGLQVMPLTDKHLASVRGTYTGMLRRIHSPWEHVKPLTRGKTLQELYTFGNMEVPQVSATIVKHMLQLVLRLATADMARGGPSIGEPVASQPAQRLLHWTWQSGPAVSKRTATISNVISRHMGRTIAELSSDVKLARDACDWKPLAEHIADRVVTHDEEVLRQAARRHATSTVLTDVLLRTLRSQSDTCDLDTDERIKTQFRTLRAWREKLLFAADCGLSDTAVANARARLEEVNRHDYAGREAFDGAPTVAAFICGDFVPTRGDAAATCGAGVFYGPADPRNIGFSVTDGHCDKRRATLEAALRCLTDNPGSHVHVDAYAHRDPDCVDELDALRRKSFKDELDALCRKSLKTTDLLPVYRKLRVELRVRRMRGLRFTLDKVPVIRATPGHKAAAMLARQGGDCTTSSDDILRLFSEDEQRHALCERRRRDRPERVLWEADGRSRELIEESEGTARQLLTETERRQSHAIQERQELRTGALLKSTAATSPAEPAAEAPVAEAPAARPRKKRRAGNDENIGSTDTLAASISPSVPPEAPVARPRKKRSTGKVNSTVSTDTSTASTSSVPSEAAAAHPRRKRRAGNVDSTGSTDNPTTSSPPSVACRAPSAAWKTKRAPTGEQQAPPAPRARRTRNGSARVGEMPPGTYKRARVEPQDSRVARRRRREPSPVNAPISSNERTAESPHGAAAPPLPCATPSDTQAPAEDRSVTDPSRATPSPADLGRLRRTRAAAIAAYRRTEARNSQRRASDRRLFPRARQRLVLRLAVPLAEEISRSFFEVADTNARIAILRCSLIDACRIRLELLEKREVDERQEIASDHQDVLDQVVTFFAETLPRVSSLSARSVIEHKMRRRATRAFSRASKKQSALRASARRPSVDALRAGKTTRAKAPRERKVAAASDALRAVKTNCARTPRHRKLAAAISRLAPPRNGCKRARNRHTIRERRLVYQILRSEAEDRSKLSQTRLHELRDLLLGLRLDHTVIAERAAREALEQTSTDEYDGMRRAACSEIASIRARTPMSQTHMTAFARTCPARATISVTVLTHASQLVRTWLGRIRGGGRFLRVEYAAIQSSSGWQPILDSDGDACILPANIPTTDDDDHDIIAINVSPEHKETFDTFSLSRPRECAKRPRPEQQHPCRPKAMDGEPVTAPAGDRTTPPTVRDLTLPADTTAPAVPAPAAALESVHTTPAEGQTMPPPACNVESPADTAAPGPLSPAAVLDFVQQCRVSTTFVVEFTHRTSAARKIWLGRVTRVRACLSVTYVAFRGPAGWEPIRDGDGDASRFDTTLPMPHEHALVHDILALDMAPEHADCFNALSRTPKPKRPRIEPRPAAIDRTLDNTTTSSPATRPFGRAANTAMSRLILTVAAGQLSGDADEPRRVRSHKKIAVDRPESRVTRIADITA